MTNSLTQSYGKCKHKGTCHFEEKNMEDMKRKYEKPASYDEKCELELNDQQWEVEQLWQKAYDLHEQEMINCQTLGDGNSTEYLNCGVVHLSPDSSIQTCLKAVRLLEDMDDLESELGLVEYYGLNLEEVYLKIKIFIQLRKSEGLLERLEVEIRNLQNGRDKVASRLKKIRSSKKRDEELQKVRGILETMCLVVEEPVEEDLPF